MDVSTKTKGHIGPSPRSKRVKNEETMRHEETFQTICEVAKEEGFLLYRVIDDDDSDVTALACGLCPEYFSPNEEKAFQQHILFHFAEGGASEAFRCPYSFIGCTFCASAAMDLDRHIRSHTDPRTEALNVSVSAPPAKKLLLQFGKPMGSVIFNLQEKSVRKAPSIENMETEDE